MTKSKEWFINGVFNLGYDITEVSFKEYYSKDDPTKVSRLEVGVSYNNFDIDAPNGKTNLNTFNNFFVSGDTSLDDIEDKLKSLNLKKVKV